MYVPIFWGLDARGGRKLRTDTHTYTHPRDNYSNPRCAHACRGLTSVIQSLDQGVVKALNVYYRKTMVQSLIHTIDSGTTASEFKMTLLEGLQFLRRAWESVTPATIVNFFRKAGFVVS